MVPILDTQVSQNTDTCMQFYKTVAYGRLFFSFPKFVYKKLTIKNVGYPAFSWVNSS